jgi:hypothetical protein
MGPPETGGGGNSLIALAALRRYGGLLAPESTPASFRRRRPFVTRRSDSTDYPKPVFVVTPDKSAAPTAGPDEGDCGEANPESDLSAPAEQGSGLAREQAASFVKDSLQAFAQFLVERFADAHGLGVLYRVVKWGYGVIEWARVAEDGGGVNVQAALPLGPADVLSVSVHLRGDPDAAPVSFCIAPSGESGVGAVALGPVEIDPAPGSADLDGDGLQHLQETPWPVEIVPFQLSQALANPGLRPASARLDAAQAAAAARRLAEQELLPGLLERRQLLQDAGVDLVLGYDAAMGIAVWVDLSDADRRSGPVTVRAVEDQLQVGIRPGVVDLVVRADPVTGPSVWLHLKSAERRSAPVVIRCDAAGRLEVAVAPDAKPESSEPATLTKRTIPLIG